MTPRRGIGGRRSAVVLGLLIAYSIPLVQLVVAQLWKMGVISPAPNGPFIQTLQAGSGVAIFLAPFGLALAGVALRLRGPVLGLSSSCWASGRDGPLVPRSRVTRWHCGRALLNRSPAGVEAAGERARFGASGTRRVSPWFWPRKPIPLILLACPVSAAGATAGHHHMNGSCCRDPGRSCSAPSRLLMEPLRHVRTAPCE